VKIFLTTKTQRHQEKPLNFVSWNKTYGIYTFEEVRKELQQGGLTQLFYEKIRRGLFAHHHLVLQKA
jgi:hypothetical protein